MLTAMPMIELTLTKMERRRQKEARCRREPGRTMDIQTRLRRAQGVILTETWSNKWHRTRVPRDIYQARTKKVVKSLERGRGDR